MFSDRRVNNIPTVRAGIVRANPTINAPMHTRRMLDLPAMRAVMLGCEYPFLDSTTTVDGRRRLKMIIVIMVRMSHNF